MINPKNVLVSEEKIQPKCEEHCPQIPVRHEYPGNHVNSEEAIEADRQPLALEKQAISKTYPYGLAKT